MYVPYPVFYPLLAIYCTLCKHTSLLSAPQTCQAPSYLRAFACAVPSALRTLFLGFWPHNPFLPLGSNLQGYVSHLLVEVSPRPSSSLAHHLVYLFSNIHHWNFLKTFYCLSSMSMGVPRGQKAPPSCSCSSAEHSVEVVVLLQERMRMAKVAGTLVVMRRTH